MGAEIGWGLNEVRWSEEHRVAPRREAWRIWRADHGRPAPDLQGRPPVQNDHRGSLSVEASAALSSEEPVLWHQVSRGEDWSGLVARYNVADPSALLAANGLVEAGPLVPGEWVCVPCRLVRPVWEIDPEGGSEEDADG
ncbi:LysM peptidoglycan-binding domain-containing protein [Limnochorda pilosa]|uniref:LysM domain-containing protein n=1 Tax=Limnochorda pilosa TaxID=1555112 RepID=A0A0K2SRF0_LIMPI|nr:LysM domain-containing protein [Limnochorda pilosa]BAS29419.1 hypothetical protein LIP_3611 [Limnochorda pilosa]